MSWSYRILRHPDGTVALHEVYFHEDGQPHSYAEPPASFVLDGDEGPQGIIASLELALRDAKERPVLDAATIGKGKVPNAVTLAAMAEADRGEGVRFDSVTDLMRDLNAD
ncbi:MAG: hypothetical protein WBP58_05190 [Chitinophagaceae bacterium]